MRGGGESPELAVRRVPGTWRWWKELKMANGITETIRFDLALRVANGHTRTVAHKSQTLDTVRIHCFALADRDRYQPLPQFSPAFYRVVETVENICKLTATNMCYSLFDSSTGTPVIRHFSRSIGDALSNIR